MVATSGAPGLTISGLGMFTELGGAVAVRVSTVERKSLQGDFSANGNFAPAQQVNLAAENAGRVTSVLVDEGSYVRVGQTLAVIKMDQLSIDAESAEAAYQSALRDQERFENAYRTGGVTQQQLDQVRLQATTARSRLEQARKPAAIERKKDVFLRD